MILIERRVGDDRGARGPTLLPSIGLPFQAGLSVDIIIAINVIDAGILSLETCMSLAGETQCSKAQGGGVYGDQKGGARGLPFLVYIDIYINWLGWQKNVNFGKTFEERIPGSTTECIEKYKKKEACC